MRQILLNGKYYKIQGDIIKRAVSPWMAKVSSGSREFSDFSQVQLEEWHDFRNGIGLESMLPAESARTWFTEGIDFTTPRSAVLGPLVTTAGAFDVAPVKIIDFQDKTYAIGNNLIAKWITGAETDQNNLRPNAAGADTELTASTGDNYTCVDEVTASDADYVETSATATLQRDLYNVTASWGSGTISKVTVKARCKEDSETVGLCELSVRSGSTTDEGTQQSLTTSWAVYSSDWTTNPDTGDPWTWAEIPALQVGVRLYNSTSTDGTKCSQVYAEVHYVPTVSSWDPKEVNLASPLDAIVVTDAADEYLVVSSASTAVYWDGVNTVGEPWATLSTVKGYLAFYDTKLYGITTDGGTLYYSAANNIDGSGDDLSLSGNFGMVYDLFEGKLLADGTPVLYMCGTEGLFTIDVANAKAYKQEVEYPPLTNAGHKGMYWNGNVWVTTGFGILKVTPSMATFVGPDLDDGLPKTYQGSIFDMVAVNNWLVYCVNKTSSSDKSSIIKRNSSYGGNLQVYTSAADTAIACLHHSPSSLYSPGRLWFGEGTDVKYMPFPDTTSNVKQVTDYEYVDDSGYGKFPTLRKLAAIPKVALGYAAITKSCDDSDYISLYYGLDGANPTTLLGHFKTSPNPTLLTFNNGLGIEFYTIQPAIKLIRGSTTTNSPELESLLFYYMPRPAIINAWTFNVLCIEDNAEELITEFEAIRDTKVLVVFNPTGDEKKTDFNYNVALTTMPLKFYVENQAAREGLINITVEQIFEG